MTSLNLYCEFLTLCSSMQERRPITLRSKDGRLKFTGIVNSIEAEDGSGHCWNVTMDDDSVYFVRSPK